jgi:hypothetical protein
MRRTRTWPVLALVAALGAANGGCMLIPEIKDRIVELAVGGSTVVEFVTNSATNAIDETNTVDVLDGFNLAQILDDAGIDVSRVTNIALSGLEYRVTVPDADPTRQIVNGNITISRGLATNLDLVSGFSAPVGAVSNWEIAPLDPGGAAVTEINTMLNQILGSLQGGPPANTTLGYHLTGQCTPATPFQFTWELKVKITITGTVDVSVPT